MATQLVHPPIPASQVAQPLPPITKMIRAISASHYPKSKSSRFGERSSGYRPIGVAEHSSGLLGSEELEKAPAQIKTDLFQALQGIPTLDFSTFFNLFSLTVIPQFCDPNTSLNEVLLSGFWVWIL